MQRLQHPRHGRRGNYFWDSDWSAHERSTTTGIGRAPAATVTVFDTTVLSTAYVTVYATPTQPGSAVSGWLTTPTATSSRTQLSSPSLISGNSSRPANSTHSQFHTLTWAVAPPVVTQDFTTSSYVYDPADNADVSAAPTTDATMDDKVEAIPPGQKRAIIGGLSGTIAGLVLAGFIIFLILRRRRKRQEACQHDEESTSEKDVWPDVAQKRNGLVTAAPLGPGSPRDSHPPPPNATQIAVDEDQRIIRMSTQHWPRPYAVGEGEGYRETVPSGQLRVVNPDLSRPNTPKRPSTDTAGSFFRKQQSAFAGFVFNLQRSSGQSGSERSTRVRETPTIAIVDSSSARECVRNSVTAPSFRSYPSLASLPIIHQQFPDDPFLTPLPDSDKKNEKPLPSTGRQRPSLATQQSAPGSASKILNDFGSNLLQPFRKKAPPQLKQAHISSSTYSSRISRRSDPFDLDRPSMRGSRNITGGQSEPSRSRFSHYDGT